MRVVGRLARSRIRRRQVRQYPRSVRPHTTHLGMTMKPSLSVSTRSSMLIVGPRLVVHVQGFPWEAPWLLLSTCDARGIRRLMRCPIHRFPACVTRTQPTPSRPTGRPESPPGSNALSEPSTWGITGDEGFRMWDTAESPDIQANPVVARLQTPRSLHDPLRE